MKGKPMKAFKAWAVVRGDVCTLVELTKEMADLRKFGKAQVVIEVEVRPLPKKKPAAGVRGKR